MNTVTAATPHRRTAVTAIGLLAVAGLSGCGGDSVNDTAELPSTSSTISAAVSARGGTPGGTRVLPAEDRMVSLRIRPLEGPGVR